MTSADRQRPLRLGVIGMSEGNGHPYSWSAICNGYDADAMASCPFPAIPAYLAARSFPADQIPGVQVTHVFTEEPAVSRHIAQAARIPNVVQRLGDLIGQVDAVLLARDDAENHLRFAAPFLEAGCPIYIDKPLALSEAAAQALYDRQRYEGQIFSCSALRYARELHPPEGLGPLGPLRRVEARTPKGWAKYAPHIIEPTLRLLAFRPAAVVSARKLGRRIELEVRVDDTLVQLVSTGESAGPIELELTGLQGVARLTFADAFTAFKSALEAFIRSVRTRAPTIPRAETLAVVRLIEAGLAAGPPP